MLNSTFDARVSTMDIKTTAQVYNSMWLNAHAVRVGECIAVLGSNSDTEALETWFACVEKFIKVKDTFGERVWDVIMDAISRTF